MPPIVTIGSLELDLIHVALLLLAVGLGVYLWQARQGGALERQRLLAERDGAQGEVTRLRQREQTLDAVARDAQLKLAAAEARSAEDERKFAELAQGVLARANTMLLERAEETFKRHREGAQGEVKELMKPIG